jgi:hypothetical protein
MKDSALEIRTGTEQNFQKALCSDSGGDIAHSVTEQFKFPTGRARGRLRRMLWGYQESI